MFRTNDPVFPRVTLSVLWIGDHRGFHSLRARCGWRQVYGAGCGLGDWRKRKRKRKHYGYQCWVLIFQ